MGSNLDGTQRAWLCTVASMRSPFAHHWESLALRGGVAIAFGLIAFLWPGMTLAALVLLFGAYTLLDGIAAIVIGTRQRARQHAWSVMLEGLAGMGLGLATFSWTRTAAELVVVLIALWAIATGLLELFAAMRLRRELPGQALLGVGGVASMLLGFAILLWPTAGAPTLVALLGSYTLVFGTAMLVQGLRLRRAVRRLEEDDSHLGPGPLVALR
jgi:uncharacterized membrane protein HdeD (DUF308 family)